MTDTADLGPLGIDTSAAATDWCHEQPETFSRVLASSCQLPKRQCREIWSRISSWLLAPVPHKFMSEHCTTLPLTQSGLRQICVVPTTMQPSTQPRECAIGLSPKGFVHLSEVVIGQQLTTPMGQTTVNAVTPSVSYDRTWKIIAGNCNATVDTIFSPSHAILCNACCNDVDTEVVICSGSRDTKSRKAENKIRQFTHQWLLPRQINPEHGHHCCRALLDLINNHDYD